MLALGSETAETPALRTKASREDLYPTQQGDKESPDPGCQENGVSTGLGKRELQLEAALELGYLFNCMGDWEVGEEGAGDPKTGIVPLHL